MILSKIKHKKGPGHEYINLEQVTRITVYPQRYQVFLSDKFSFFADKTDPIISALVTAADA